jgi:hypothetical protein
MKQETRLNPVLTLDEEFESKIPPLTDDEYRQLEENIVSEGMVLMPLIVWNNTIVDGHNRYKIVQAHPGIIFDVFEKDFENRYEAIAWICKNQLGRRNLTPTQIRILVGERYNAEKKAELYCGNQHTLSKESRVDKICPPQKQHGTRTRIAKELNVSEGYVGYASSYANGVSAADEASPGFRQRVLSGKIKPTQKEMQAIARASPQERKSLIDNILHPTTKTVDKETLAAIQEISDDMGKDDKPGIAAQDAVVQFEWKVTRTLQSFDSTFDDWPQLISEDVYRQQVLATLQDLEKYILHIKGGSRYEWDQDARKIV